MKSCQVSRLANEDSCDITTTVISYRLVLHSSTGSEANERYPEALTLPSKYKCVIENEGGILHANRAVAALQVEQSNIGSRGTHTYGT